MKKHVCYLFICNDFSDWEPALAIATLRKHFNFELLTFSLDGQPIRSMGNLLVQPNYSMEEVQMCCIKAAVWITGFSTCL